MSKPMFKPMSKPVSNPVVKPNPWRRRVWRIAVTGVLMGTSFAAGVLLTGYIAARLLVPIAAVSLTTGLLGMASASAQATIDALYSGDSGTRLAVLTQLKESFESHPPESFDPATAGWILPAIEQCRTDSDPGVVALAEELIEFIHTHRIPHGN